MISSFPFSLECYKICKVAKTKVPNLLFGLPKEDTTRNQWLCRINNTVPEQFNPNIQMCAAHFMEDEACFLEE